MYVGVFGYISEYLVEKCFKSSRKVVKKFIFAETDVIFYPLTIHKKCILLLFYRSPEQRYKFRLPSFKNSYLGKQK